MTAATIEWLSDACVCIKFFAIAVCFAVVIQTVVYFFDEWRDSSNCFSIKKFIFSIKKFIILVVCALLITFVPNEHFWKILEEQYGL